MYFKLLLCYMILATFILAGEGPPPIACNMKALTRQQRKQLLQIADQVIPAIIASRELNDGYALSIDPKKASLLDVAQWLDLWRRCCRFYEFQIDVHAAGGGLWLTIKGRQGVKEYIPQDSPKLAAKISQH